MADMSLAAKNFFFEVPGKRPKRSAVLENIFNDLCSIYIYLRVSHSNERRRLVFPFRGWIPFYEATTYKDVLMADS